MSLLSAHEPEPTPPRRRGLRYGVILLAVALAAGAATLLWPLRDAPDPEGERAAASPPPAAPAAPAAPEPAPEPEAEREPEPSAPEAEPEPEPAAEPAAPPPPPPVVLRVTSDVDGAQVFIDRRFAGTTPFESYEVEPGRRRINVSAPGYDGHAEEVEITDELTTVAVRFREVRLDAEVAVVHRHRFGDCEGHLTADAGGIAYRTDDDDAFEVAFDRIEEFTIDYLEHNLRLKVRGGRTYNFTDHEANADALFVFHREVEQARERLAGGTRAAVP